MICTNLRPISLGNAAVFLIGGLTRDVAPIPILLRSGDIVIMSGPACRRAYHGVPRILEGTLPAHLGEGNYADDGSWVPYARYMNTTRININVRQVFPKGFNPSLAQI
jgi:alkylated DNA repair protein alkB family protein 1